MIHIQTSQEGHSNELIQLFAKEKKHAENLFTWQKRSPEFHSCYDHFKTAKCNYWLGYDHNNQLVGSYNLIPMKTCGDVPATTYYGTDFFFDPDRRDFKTVWHFTSESMPSFADFLQPALCWGVENKSGVIRGFHRISKRGNLNFNYIGLTLLRELYNHRKCSELKIKTNHRLEELHGTKEIEKNLSPSTVASWRDFEGPHRHFVSAYDSKTFDHLRQMDPTLSLYISKDPPQALLVTDLSAVRELCWTGRNSSLFEELQFTDPSFKKGSALKMKILTFFGQRNTQVAESLFAAAWPHLLKTGFHVLILRDSPLSQNWPHQFLNIYSRRVWTLSHSKHRQLNAWLGQFTENSRWQLESLFL